MPPQPEINPYGVLGLVTDCETNSLYAASVAGSTPDAEHGRLYRVDLASGAVTPLIDQVDAFGLAIYTTTAREKRLYYSLARAPEVWSVALDATGARRGEPRREFSFAELAMSAESRARRLSFDAEDNLVLTVSDFAFTLMPPPQTDRLIFRYDARGDQWILADGS